MGGFVTIKRPLMPRGFAIFRLLMMFEGPHSISSNNLDSL